MKHMTAVVMAGMVLVLSTASVSFGQGEEQNQDQTVAEVLGKLQGKWELTRRVRNRTLRSVKVVEGNRTRLTRFDENGAIYWAHTSNFKIEITEKVRVFTFFNLEVTAGPNKGSKSKESSSYIFRVDDSDLVEAHGLLVGEEETAPRIVIWKRANDEIAAETRMGSGIPHASVTE